MSLFILRKAMLPSPLDTSPVLDSIFSDLQTLPVPSMNPACIKPVFALINHKSGSAFQIYSDFLVLFHGYILTFWYFERPVTIRLVISWTISFNHGFIYIHGKLVTLTSHREGNSGEEKFSFWTILWTTESFPLFHTCINPC